MYCRYLRPRLRRRAPAVALTFLAIAPNYSRSDEPAIEPLQDVQNWRFEDPAAWDWQIQEGVTTLVLEKPSHYKPEFRRPLNLAWYQGNSFDSFVMSGELRLDSFNQGNNDLCLAFGRVDESKFYYAHLGESADNVHLHLHIVDQADRRAITTDRGKTIPWRPNQWHRFKLVRDSSDGRIAVWFEDQLILESIDKTFTHVEIGLGSFDDLGAFRNVVIQPGTSSSLHP
jgi:hypothetical protein